MKDLTVGDISNWLLECILGWLTINFFIIGFILLFNVVHKLVY